MSGVGDLPGMIVRRRGVFADVDYLPEWEFWHYVAGKIGSDAAFAVAEEAGRHFVEVPPPYRGALPKYAELYRTYSKDWWASIPRARTTRNEEWDSVNLMGRLQKEAERLQNEVSWKTHGMARLDVFMLGAGQNPPRIEFDIGTVPSIFGVSVYNPMADRYLAPQLFFGFWGPGQIAFWNIEELDVKIEKVFRFFGVFLPASTACVRSPA